MRTATKQVEHDITERHMRRIRPHLGIQPVEVYEPRRRSRAWAAWTVVACGVVVGVAWVVWR